MAGEKAKVDTAEKKPIEKAKVAIVDVVDGIPSILVLTRSEQEETRKGEGDWAGGTLNPGETPRQGVRRETEQEELPGVVLEDLTKLAEPHEKNKDGVRIITHFFVARAQLPEGGLELSVEHSDGGFIPLDEFSGVTMPGKYHRAIDSGRLVIDNLLSPVSQREPDPVYA